MSGFYKKAVVWLGLNEEYADGGGDYEASPDGDDSLIDDASAQLSSSGGSGSSPGPHAESGSGSGTIRAIAADADMDEDPLAPKPLGENRDSTTVRAYPMNDSTSSSTSAGSSGTVRAVPMAKSVVPETVVPTSYNNAQDVADVFKDGKPVLVDLVSAERDLSRRLIDFSAGLCYGLGGRMEKLKSDVYLLVPDGVEVNNDEIDGLT